MAKDKNAYTEYDQIFCVNCKVNYRPAYGHNCAQYAEIIFYQKVEAERLSLLPEIQPDETYQPDDNRLGLGQYELQCEPKNKRGDILLSIVRIDDHTKCLPSQFLMTGIPVFKNLDEVKEASKKSGLTDFYGWNFWVKTAEDIEQVKILYRILR